MVYEQINPEAIFAFCICEFDWKPAQHLSGFYTARSCSGHSASFLAYLGGGRNGHKELACMIANGFSGVHTTCDALLARRHIEKQHKLGGARAFLLEILRERCAEATRENTARAFEGYALSLRIRTFYGV